MSRSADSPLFRPEAIAQRCGALEGPIRLTGLNWHGPAALLAVLLLSGLLALGLLGQASRKVRVPGVVLPPGGLLHLAAPHAGRLLALHVRQGDAVQQGQRLATVQTSGSGASGDTATAIAQQLQARQAALHAERRSVGDQASHRELQLRARSRSLETELELAVTEVAAAERRGLLAEQAEVRDQALHQQGFVSAGQLQTREAERLDASIRVQAARRAAQALRRSADELAAETAALRAQTAQQLAQLDRASASVEQERHELDARSLWVISAPSDGTVGALPASEGQPLPAGQTVLSLSVPGSAVRDTTAQSLQATLFAPSRAIGFVAAGQAVWLKLHAYPHQKFGMLAGHVDDVSTTPVAPADLPAGMGPLLLSGLGAQEPLYRITVRLADATVNAGGVAHRLKAGMTLDADILQERRALWEWLLEPLLTARMRLGMPPP